METEAAVFGLLLSMTATPCLPAHPLITNGAGSLPRGDDGAAETLSSIRNKQSGVKRENSLLRLFFRNQR